MNRQDQADRLTEQVHRLDFAAALRREEEQMVLQRADMRISNFQTRRWYPCPGEPHRRPRGCAAGASARWFPKKKPGEARLARSASQ
jgi:hypothetical protein